MSIEDNMTEREARIFDAAIEIFSKKGYNATTTKDIAQAAGVAEGTIFRYYKTKKDILNAVLKKFIEVMSGPILHPVEEIFKNSDDKDLRQLLYEIMLDRLEIVEKFYPLFSIIMSEVLINESLRETLYNSLISRALAMFGDFHKRMIDRNLMRADISPDTVFRTIFANIFLFIAQHKLFPSGLTQQEIDLEFKSVVEAIINGIACK